MLGSKNRLFCISLCVGTFIRVWYTGGFMSESLASAGEVICLMSFYCTVIPHLIECNVWASYIKSEFLWREIQFTSYAVQWYYQHASGRHRVQNIYVISHWNFILEVLLQATIHLIYHPNCTKACIKMTPKYLVLSSNIWSLGAILWCNEPEAISAFVVWNGT